MTRRRFVSSAPVPVVLVGMACALPLIFIAVGSAQEAAPGVRDYVLEAIIDVPGSFSTVVYGINSRGWVAGRYSAGPECDAPEIAFVWKKGTFEYLSFPGASSTRADGVNDRGFVTGSYGPDRCYLHGRDGFVMTPRGEFLTVSFPFSIHQVVNKITPSGWMVGPYVDSGCTWGNLADGCIHSFLYRGDELHTVDPPGSVMTDAIDINARGEVVGYYRRASEKQNHGFLLKAGAYETIDFPGASSTDLWAINAAGAVAGMAYGTGLWVSFIYDRGQFTSVNLLTEETPYRFTVTNVSNTGTIVGNLIRMDGTARGYVARPAK